MKQKLSCQQIWHEGTQAAVPPQPISSSFVLFITLISTFYQTARAYFPFISCHRVVGIFCFCFLMVNGNLTFFPLIRVPWHGNLTFFPLIRFPWHGSNGYHGTPIVFPLVPADHCRKWVNLLWGRAYYKLILFKWKDFSVEDQENFPLSVYGFIPPCFPSSQEVWGQRHSIWFCILQKLFRVWLHLLWKLILGWPLFKCPCRLKKAGNQCFISWF